MIALVCLLALLPAAGVMAQDAGEEVGRGSFRFPSMSPTTSDTDAPDVGAAKGVPWSMPRVIVDTDAGVDDAAALAWLFRKAGKNPSEILGITTVVGNTTVWDATENVLFLMTQAPWKPKKHPDVIMGAVAPMEQIPSKTGQLLHGLDGMGYARMFSGWTSSPGDVDGTDTTAFYCDNAKDSKDGNKITVVALGPLTNIALALDKSVGCPDRMTNYRFVVLGGARESGNQTPTGEYNFWQDPEAAQIVLNAGLDITLVPREQFDKFTLTLEQVESLLRTSYSDTDPWGGVANVVGQSLCWFAGMQSVNFATGEPLYTVPVSIPDPAAMMYALNPTRYGAAGVRAYVQVPDAADPDDLLTRGQSVIGYYEPYPEAFTMGYSDEDINGWIDASFAANPYDPMMATLAFYGTLVYNQEAIEANTSIPSDLYGRLMRSDYLLAFRVDGPTQGSCFPDPDASTSAAVLSGLTLDGLYSDTQDPDPVPSVFIPLLSQ